VLHGGSGVIGNAEEGRTFYYSNTRLAAEGTLRSGTTEYEVTGEAWMDHQWFDRDVPQESLVWDWFALQLDDQTDLMVTVLRWSQQDVWFGTLVDADARATQLGDGDIEIESRSSWTNPSSGNTYPLAWEVRLPRHGVQLEVSPALLDQELYGLQYTPVDYWEGAVDVRGTHAGARVTGRGYVELVGAR
jgi:predicted secreted hydrolase